MEPYRGEEDKGEITLVVGEDEICMEDRMDVRCSVPVGLCYKEETAGRLSDQGWLRTNEN